MTGGGGTVAVAVGHLRACALTPVGGVKCWGANTTGQLSSGSLEDSLVSPRAPPAPG